MILKRKSDVPSLDPYKVLNLAYAIFLSFVVYLFCVTFVPIPDSGQDNAKYIVGFMVGSGLTTIIAFYFRRSGNPEGPPEPLNTETRTQTTIQTESVTDSTDKD